MSTQVEYEEFENDLWSAEHISVSDGVIIVDGARSYSILPSSGCGDPAHGAGYELFFYPQEIHLPRGSGIFAEPLNGARGEFNRAVKVYCWVESESGSDAAVMFEARGDDGPGCFYDGFVIERL